MRGDDLRTVENRDRALVDDDLDVIAHEAVRHAVSHRVDVDKGIGRDPPAEPLLAARQRPHRQRSEGGALLPLEATIGASRVVPWHC